ncbi:MAG: chemotaxis protein CheW [Deltaproteobacteria bacterium]|nr:chemotaxis protein CheW [Deltaproteobacteria bacterium]
MPSAEPLRSLVVFTMDAQRYAIPLAAIERVFPTAEITPIPKAPEIVLGVVDIRGRVVPVVNIRRRFRLPEREPEIYDHMIVASMGKRAVAFVVDGATGVLEIPESEITSLRDLLPRTEYVEGVIRLPGRPDLIHDLETFLSLEEEKLLDRAMSEP